MATRNIPALDYQGQVYVSLEDLQAYVAALVSRADGYTGREVLHEIIYQLARVREQRPV